jgi:chemotaxis receptor (MCP) glutamine deamidase CheD
MADTTAANHPAPNLYYDKQFESDAAKLLPGEYYVTRNDMVLVTVLGSCVAACIRDVNSGVGGMNHFMLPDSGSDRGTPASESARYGAFAMEVLVNELLKLGARRPNLEAKVFGGGAVMSGLTQANVGERNAAFVLEYLQTEGIRLAPATCSTSTRARSTSSLRWRGRPQAQEPAQRHHHAARNRLSLARHPRGRRH